MLNKRAGFALLCGVTLNLFSTTTLAGEHVHMFSYSSLYQQIKYNEDYDEAKVGVFFTHPSTQEPCQVVEAKLDYRSHQQSIPIADNNEILVPADDDIADDNPSVYVKTESDTTCKISMLIMNKQRYIGGVSYRQLRKLHSEMKLLIQDISQTMPIKHIPKVKGIIVQFESENAHHIKTHTGRVFAVDNHQINLSSDELRRDDMLILPTGEVRITPQI